MKHPTSKEIEFDCKTLKDKFCKDTEYQECKSELWDNPFLDLIKFAIIGSLFVFTHV